MPGWARLRGFAIWLAVFCAIALPLWIAATSPLLQWRDPIYILSGFEGVFGLALMLMQPLLAAGVLPGLSGAQGRHAHLWGAAALFSAVILHVAGLWVTSPPDVVDALLFRSPTPFAI